MSPRLIRFLVSAFGILSLPFFTVRFNASLYAVKGEVVHKKDTQIIKILKTKEKKGTHNPLVAGSSSAGPTSFLPLRVAGNAHFFLLFKNTAAENDTHFSSGERNNFILS